MDYKQWAWELIGIICADKQVTPGTKVEEIRCVLREDGHYPDSFRLGDSPSDAWLEEVISLQEG